MRRTGFTFLLITILIFTLLFAESAVSFAADSGENTGSEFTEELVENILLPDDTFVENQDEFEIMPFDDRNITVSLNFTKSSGKGKATVQAFKPGATKMVSSIQLQEIAPRTGEFINSSAKPASASKNSSVTIGNPVS